jgi:arylsulfatase A-like enzyme
MFAKNHGSNQKLSRRGFLQNVGIHILGCLATPSAILLANKSSHSKRPNILVIVSDDQGWDDIGYHNPEIRTPNLDRLAREGMKLENHYVQPQCTPTRVALMTGRYPSRFGPHCTAASNDCAYPRGTLTMASMLKSQDYETALIGKWHMGSKPEWGPNHYGFDYSYGSLAGAVGMYDHRYRLNTPYARTWHRNHKYIEQEGHATDLTADEAVAWLERKRSKPFFLYLPFNAVHTPLVERDKKWHEMNAHIQNKDRRLFAAAVSHMDAAIGRVVNTLKRLGQYENTLIIFTSDNGGIQTRYAGGNYPPPDPALAAGFSSNKPLRGQKSEVYEGGIRVPAFIHWPDKVKSNETDTPIHVVDWMPTLAAIVGFKTDADPKWDGRDLSPLLAKPKQDIYPSRCFYWDWSNRYRVALRCGPWKILRNDPKAPWELYNLADDPYETKNLADENPNKLQNMLKLVEQEKSKDKLNK